MSAGMNDTEVISVVVVARKGTEYRYFTIDPKTHNSIYWSGDAVIKILAPFYENHLPQLWNDEGIAPSMLNSVARFRKLYPGCQFAQKQLCDYKEHEAITGTMIQNLWHYGHANGAEAAVTHSRDKALFLQKEKGDDCGTGNQSFRDGTLIAGTTLTLTLDNDRVCFPKE